MFKNNNLTQIYYNEIIEKYFPLLFSEKGKIVSDIEQVLSLRKNQINYIKEIARKENIAIQFSGENNNFLSLTIINRESHSSKSFYYYIQDKKVFYSEYSGNNPETLYLFNNIIKNNK